MSQYCALEEAFPDKPWPKRSHPVSSAKNKVEVRDAEKEGRIFPTPIARSEHAIKANKKIIDDLTGSLPIAQSDDESNFHPIKLGSKENFTSTKQGYTRPFHPTDDGTSFAYAPPSFKQAGRDVHLEKLYKLLDQQGGETPATQDLLLYIFTGVFFLFTFDTFVTLGKNLR